MTHSIKCGDMVTVYNQTLSGKRIREGRAKVIEVLDDEPNPMCKVRFPDDGMIVHRTIEPQERPSGAQQMVDHALFNT